VAGRAVAKAATRASTAKHRVMLICGGF